MEGRCVVETEFAGFSMSLPVEAASDEFVRVTGRAAVDIGAERARIVRRFPSPIDERHSRVAVAPGSEQLALCEELKELVGELLHRGELPSPASVWRDLLDDDDFDLLVDDVVAPCRALLDKRLPFAASGRRQPGNLDREAVNLAKQWDEEGRSWQLKELAAALKTGHPSLIGKRNGKPRCPMFFVHWQDRLRKRAEAREDLAGGAG
jgi:hypothetical protein